MRALIIDSEELAAGLLKSRLEALGYETDIEPSKDHALETLKEQNHTLIFLDPAPLSDGRMVIQKIRHIVGHYAYIILLSAQATQEDAVKMGANDVIAKPVDPATLEQESANAQRLLTRTEQLGNTSEDFPSAGGVISKSAFNQLYLSGLDRAERYGERLFVLFIALHNYEDIRKFDGPHAADFAAAKLSQHLVNLRRQTDIIGQTKPYEFALLLQRPERASEPVDATSRFADALSKIQDMASTPDIKLEITLSLLALPTGAQDAHLSFTL